MRTVNKMLLLLAVVLFLAINFQFTEARSGCCSHHGGVCACAVSGNKCCDGTSLSAKCSPHYPTCVEKTTPKPPPKPESKPEPKPQPKTESETETKLDEQSNTEADRSESKQDSNTETTTEPKPTPEDKTKVTETKDEKQEESKIIDDNKKEDKPPISGSAVETIKNESQDKSQDNKLSAKDYVYAMVFLAILFGFPLALITSLLVYNSYIKKRN